jgi:hypothetical protein
LSAQPADYAGAGVAGQAGAEPEALSCLCSGQKGAMRI